MPQKTDVMLAAVCTRYGAPETVDLVQMPIPQPQAGQIRVRIHASTVSSADRRIRALDMPYGFKLAGRLVFGWQRPRQGVLGGDLSGVVDALGEGVQRFRLGDEVVGVAGMGLGCHARYRCLNADGALIAKPAGLFHEAAVAALFGGMTALDYLRRARLGEGEDMLVVGASGAVGSAAVQLAAHLGARVTAVCSARNGAWVTELGAERWFDYTRQTWPGPGDAFDVVLDATGTVDWRRVGTWLRPKGRFLALAGGLPDALRAPWVAATSQQRIIAGPAGEHADDIRMLMQRMSEGTFRPHVDGVYPLERIRDAHRHVDTGHKRGSVVVTM